MGLKQQIHRALRPAAAPLARIWLQRSMSYSGAGEDRIVLAWLETYYHVDVRQMRYCDIGANHPSELNNTFLFYQLGASGVLVEPDPDLCRILRSERSRDVVLNVGAAFDMRRSAMLQRLTSRVFNTFSPAQAAFDIASSKNWRSEQRQEIVDEIEVDLLPVNDIISEYFLGGIDFLSIDAEGVDLAILKSIDFDRFRPKIICVEATADAISILGPYGYEFVARTPDNVIFRLIR